MRGIYMPTLNKIGKAKVVCYGLVPITEEDKKKAARIVKNRIKSAKWDDLFSTDSTSLTRQFTRVIAEQTENMPYKFPNVPTFAVGKEFEDFLEKYRVMVSIVGADDYYVKNAPRWGRKLLDTKLSYDFEHHMSVLGKKVQDEIRLKHYELFSKHFDPHKLADDLLNYEGNEFKLKVVGGLLG